MWTKGAPPSAPPLYPKTIARLMRFFEVGLRTPAMPSDVAAVIEEALTARQPRFRYPVGKDANEVIAGRTRAGDEAWINMLCTGEDERFADGWREIVGVDYYRD
jgi:hypothetical protein